MEDAEADLGLKQRLGGGIGVQHLAAGVEDEQRAWGEAAKTASAPARRANASRNRDQRAGSTAAP